MSHDEPPTMSRRERLLFSYLICIWVGPVVGVLTIILFFALGGSSAPTPNSGSKAARVEEGGLESARQSLARRPISSPAVVPCSRSTWN